MISTLGMVLESQGLSWALRDHPGLSGTVPGSWGSLQVLPSLETTQGSWGGIILGIFWDAFHLGDGFGVSRTIPGSWTPSRGLEDHPDFWAPSGVLLFLGIISEAPEVS